MESRHFALMPIHRHPEPNTGSSDLDLVSTAWYLALDLNLGVRQTQREVFFDQPANFNTLLTGICYNCIIFIMSELYSTWEREPMADTLGTEQQCIHRCRYRALHHSGTGGERQCPASYDARPQSWGQVPTPPRCRQRILRRRLKAIPSPSKGKNRG